MVAGTERARQRLLVLGAGPAQIGLLRAARERGLEQTVDWYRENEAWWRALSARDSVSSS